MSTKVEQVVNAILESPDEIADTVQEANEFYFFFRGHTFSIQECDAGSGSFDYSDCSEYGEDRFSEYKFYVYPNWTVSPSTLPYAEARGESGTESVAFSEDEFEESLLKRLHKEAKSRHFKVDAVFDDVLRKAGA